MFKKTILSVVAIATLTTGSMANELSETISAGAKSILTDSNVGVGLNSSTYGDTSLQFMLSKNVDADALGLINTTVFLNTNGEVLYAVNKPITNLNGVVLFVGPSLIYEDVKTSNDKTSKDLSAYINTSISYMVDEKLGVGATYGLSSNSGKLYLTGAYALKEFSVGAQFEQTTYFDSDKESKTNIKFIIGIAF